MPKAWQIPLKCLICTETDRSVGNPTAKANVVTVSVSEFYLVSVSEFYLSSAPDKLYGRLQWYVISKWFSIVWEPKTQSCGYAECARANRTMVIDAILQTRVPLESWKNKESFLYLTIWKKLKKKKKKSLTFWVAARGYDGCNRFLSGTRSFWILIVTLYWIPVRKGNEKYFVGVKIRERS